MMVKNKKNILYIIIGAIILILFARYIGLFSIGEIMAGYASVSQTIDSTNKIITMSASFTQASFYEQGHYGYYMPLTSWYGTSSSFFDGVTAADCNLIGGTYAEIFDSARGGGMHYTCWWNTNMWDNYTIQSQSNTLGSSVEFQKDDLKDGMITFKCLVPRCDGPTAFSATFVFCTSNCSCASNTYVGQTCSDGCNGICQGTKVCVPDCVCALDTLVGQTCSDGCGGVCQGTKVTLIGDTNGDGKISRDELGIMITNWQTGTISRTDLGLGITSWVNG